MADILTDAAALSHFSFFWGVLAESTQTKNQRTLHVYVPALTPLRNGDISDKGSITSVDLFNVMTQARDVTPIHLTRTIEAEYLGFQSGQDVPDMYKGQQVLVINYARGDHWFWTPFDRDNWIKTFEHTRLSCADIAQVHKIPDPSKLSNAINAEEIERQTALTDDNTYFLEIDTKYHKHIMLSTAASDGEKYRYFIHMDAKSHVLEIWDSLSSPAGTTSTNPHNSIKIESDPKYADGTFIRGRITVQNEAGTTIQLEDQDLHIEVPRDLKLTVGRNVVTSIGQDFFSTITGNLHSLIKGNVMKEVVGFIKAKVTGFYSYFFGSTRTEEVMLNYTLKTAGVQTNLFGSRVTTIQTTDQLTAQQITITANAQLTLAGSQQITVVSEKLISFASKVITTSTHIYGCCGCIAH